MPQTKKTWVALTVIGCLLLSVMAWLLVISPQRSTAATAREETAQLKSSNDALEIKVAELRTQFANIEDYRGQLAAMQVAMPTELQQSTAFRELQAQAVKYDLSLTSVTFDPSVPFGTEVLPSVSASASAAPSASASAAPSAAASAATGAPPNAAPVTFTIYGSYSDTLSFLRGLQRSTDRYFLVSTLAVTALSEDEQVEGVPQINEGDIKTDVAAFVFTYDSGVAAAPSADPSAEPTPMPSSKNQPFAPTEAP